MLGDKGINMIGSLLGGVNNFIIGPGDNVVSEQNNKWVATNMSADTKSLDFDGENIARLVISGMNLSGSGTTVPERIVFPRDRSGVTGQHMGELTLENSTFPSCSFYSGPNMWSGQTAKNLDYLTLSNITIHQLNLNNFNNLKQVTLKGTIESPQYNYSSSEIAFTDIKSGNAQDNKVIFSFDYNTTISTRSLKFRVKQFT